MACCSCALVSLSLRASEALGWVFVFFGLEVQGLGLAAKNRPNEQPCSEATAVFNHRPCATVTKETTLPC